VTALLSAAFVALGACHDVREFELVATALRESGDAETLAMFAYDDYEGLDAVTAVAVEAGSHGLAALDLYVEVVNPGAHRRTLARGGASREWVREAQG
jgi:hypothetical protein